YQMVNFTQVRKVTNDFMREHQKLCSFVLHLMLLGVYSPAFIFGSSIIDSSVPSAGLLWLLATMIFINMVTEDLQTKQIDIRKAAVLIILLLSVSQYDFLASVVLFAFYVLSLQFINLALLLVNFLASNAKNITNHIKSFFTKDGDKNDLDEPLELPFLPIMAVSMAIYSGSVLYFYSIGAAEIYVPLMEIHHITGDFISKIFNVNWRWVSVIQCVIVFILLCYAYHKMVENLLQSEFYKGTKFQELQGFIAPWDLFLVAAFMVVFNMFNMQFIICIGFSLSGFIKFVYESYLEIRKGDKLWQ
ncbi:hypothetical protein, partial [Anaerovibrio sp.]|uniref:hypothetical protein n=1 Tax=Anaerovibrio sp. TaxID=1872532 RepID=UPI003F17D083